MLRTISGIILGYLVFALAAVLFRITNRDPHAPATISFEISAIAYGVFFAFVAGYFGTAIGGRGDMVVAGIIAAIIFIGAVASMISQAVGWSPLAAIILMVPAELIGGYVRVRSGKRL